jgi:uncharacterized protein YaaN involved in tellurite resistance
MTSPFDRVPATKAPVKVSQLTNATPYANVKIVKYDNTLTGKASSPLDAVAKTPISTKMIYTVEDIDRIGADADAKLSQLSDRVTKKMTLNRMGDIGTMLMSVQREVNNLDPANLMKTDGLMGKIRQHFIDIKVELTKRFQTADGAFSNLTAGMTKQIVQLTEWEKDDGEMYIENMGRFKEIMTALGEIEIMLERMRAQAAAWPMLDATDPEAMMKVQEKAVLDDLINRASARRESLLRSKIKCELNAPEILAMKSASGKLVSKLKSNASDIIPEIKREIAKQIQRLNMADALKGIKSFSDFANVALTKGADATKDTVLQANQAFNDATITIGTITSMQNSVREMVLGVQAISAEAEKRRMAEEAIINQNQAAILRDIQKVPGAI